MIQELWDKNVKEFAELINKNFFKKYKPNLIIRLLKIKRYFQKKFRKFKLLEFKIFSQMKVQFVSLWFYFKIVKESI